MPCKKVSELIQHRGRADAGDGVVNEPDPLLRCRKLLRQRVRLAVRGTSCGQWRALLWCMF